MKRLIFPFLFFLTITSFAQDGFFLQPELGIGLANAHVHSELLPDPGYTQQFAPISYLTYTAGAGLGYRAGKWRVSSGLWYQRSGYISHYESGDLFYIDAKAANYNFQIMVPVVLGYEFRLCRHFFFTPSVGAAISYNLSAKIVTREEGQTYTQRITGSDFDEEYNHTSLWGMVQARFGYKVNSRLAVVAGPGAEYMLTSIQKYTTNNNYQRNYVYTFNAGVIWNFNKKAAANTVK